MLFEKLTIDHFPDILLYIFGIKKSFQSKNRLPEAK